ncbi:DUF4288 domain-containing protein [Cystobacter fuscus]|uniref:DUF4288 domain-containing protein n=1 Tax=Cystobacter fuscus TaxID=43 RepID=UPI0012FE5157|nr:DUF4288 domain-containing protein [Cystobacter fuscus]
MRGKAKTWYAASVVLFFRLKSGRQRKFTVWENVYLIAARTPAEALARAEERGRQATDPQDEITWNGKPAEIVFGGIRKLITCAADPILSNQALVTRLHDGVEATYSSFTVNSKAELDALIRGESVAVLYDEG